MEQRPVICFIVGSSGDWGGASRVIFTLLRLLNPERIEPFILLPRKGPIQEELHERGLRYAIWGPLTEFAGPWKYVKAYLRMLRFLRRERVQLVHVNRHVFWRPAELLAAFTLRVPIIVHYHVINESPSPFLRFCRAAISVSRYTADQSLPADLDKPVIYNSISLARFDAGRSLRSELGLLPTDVVVSFLGQIRKIKGVQDFIAMAHRIRDPNARFLIAGQCRDPQMYPDFFAPSDLATMIGDDKRICYIDYVSAPENVYQTSDIIVMPSRWNEPLGLINIEAGACHKPVVATRVGGIPEVVRDGITGFLVEPGDVEGLAQKVQRLIDDPEKRRRMGNAGRLHVEREFTSKTVAEFEDLLLRHVSKTSTH